MCKGVLKSCHQWVVISVFAGTFAAATAVAEPQDSWYGDIRQFHDRDFARWRSGHWAHTLHSGHAGWWWVIGRDWYSYPMPVYPFPDPYVPPGEGIEAGSTPAPGIQYWYYCSLPVGYYPYVNVCRHPWRRVVSLMVTVPPPTAALPPVAVPAPVASHEKDNRQFKLLAAELDGIRLNDPRAFDRLTDLLRRAKSFHKDLQQQAAGDPEFLKNMDKLEKRITDKRAQANRPLLSPKKQTVSGGKPAAASTPSSPPPSVPKVPPAGATAPAGTVLPHINPVAPAAPPAAPAPAERPVESLPPAGEP